jgi:hypothetical protein
MLCLLFATAAFQSASAKALESQASKLCNAQEAYLSRFESWADTVRNGFVADGGCQKGDIVITGDAQKLSDTAIAVARICDLTKPITWNSFIAICSYVGDVRNLPKSLSLVNTSP